MTNISSYGLTSVYEEDISIGAGTELIGHPATVWSVIVVIETSGTAVVSFSNSITSYSNATRCGKIVVSGPGTQQVVFAKGLPVTTGLCAVSNLGSVDVMVAYE